VYDVQVSLKIVFSIVSSCT